jgi:hypothetical protein
MDYPRLVFICPGANKCNGGTYDHELVKDAIEHKAAISAGFSDTVTEALEAMAAVKESIEAEPVAAPKRGRPAKAKE